jgi:thioredoxin 1
MRRVAALLPLLLATLCSGYSSVALAPRLHSVRPAAAAQRLGNPVAVVIDISSTEEFNDAVASAGDSLVVIDYSTSWCGPCKIIAPKYDEFSEKYKNVAFLKVMGDSSPAADKLMRSQGVRALPSFHFWKGGKQIDSISGAKTQALQDAIEANMQ